MKNIIIVLVFCVLCVGTNVAAVEVECGYSWCGGTNVAAEDIDGDDVEFGALFVSLAQNLHQVNQMPEGFNVFRHYQITLAACELLWSYGVDTSRIIIGTYNNYFAGLLGKGGVGEIERLSGYQVINGKVQRAYRSVTLEGDPIKICDHNNIAIAGREAAVRARSKSLPLKKFSKAVYLSSMQYTTDYLDYIWDKLRLDVERGGLRDFGELFNGWPIINKKMMGFAPFLLEIMRAHLAVAESAEYQRSDKQEHIRYANRLITELQELLGKPAPQVESEASHLAAAAQGPVKENNECVICQENPNTVVLLPCRHLALCPHCIKYREIAECPICRQKIADYLEIYKP